VRSEHAARHDALTGLPNRGRVQVVSEFALERYGRDRVAVLLMDLDRFKDVNDTLGHYYGDLLLQRVAERLSDAVPEAEVIARLGGDEFVVDGEASIGVAVAPHDGQDIDTLLQRADVAMYRAKETHASWARYAEEHDHHSPARLALMTDLRSAIDNGQIIVHYQPVLDLAGGRVVGVEARVRWEHPDLGLLAPGAFLDMAERTSLIKPLTRRVMDTSLRQLAEWQALGLDVTMSVNISVRSLLDPEFPAQVASLLADIDIPPRLVKLEITESTIMADPPRAMSVLSRLSEMGIRLSIDDFGVGYSSLSYLKRLPVDELKIDRSFVAQMDSDEDDAFIVRSTIDLGRNLGLSVVAEGVETEAVWDELTELGCDYAQGWYLGRPMPAADLVDWMRSAAAQAGEPLGDHQER
jgi:predicted signal transduction protein with EAL and GGDEF domain